MNLHNLNPCWWEPPELLCFRMAICLHSLWEVSDVLHSGSLEVGCHLRVPKGHSPYWDGHCVNVCNPSVLILDYGVVYIVATVGLINVPDHLVSMRPQQELERVSPSAGRLWPPWSLEVVQSLVWAQGNPGDDIKADLLHGPLVFLGFWCWALLPPTLWLQ